MREYPAKNIMMVPFSQVKVDSKEYKEYIGNKYIDTVV